MENVDAPVDVILEELRIVQTMASLRPASRCIIFLGAVFTEAVIAANQIVVHKPVLKALSPSPIQQRHLIAAWEWFCGTRHPTLLKYFPVILKNLFDEDIVDEEVFLNWGADISRNEHTADFSMISLDTLDQLKTNATPFLKWLEEAEEESDGEEDEGDEDEEDEEDGDDA